MTVADHLLHCIATFSEAAFQKFIALVGTSAAVAA
jgi:hypothetical protein